MVPDPVRSRYESLDVWRGIACLLVVLSHSAVYAVGAGFSSRVRAEGGSVFDHALVVVSGFWIGVALFFVVSGYCIAASADSARAREGGARHYFMRRARRIYPPLWAAIGLAIVVAFALPAFARPGPTGEGLVPFGPTARLGAWEWLGNLTLTESWRPALGGPGSDYVLGQLWTLCYEEQFYLVVGLVLLAAPRWFFPGVWLVTGLVLFNLSRWNPYPIHVTGVFTDGLWVSFAAGVAVYYRLNHAPPLIGVAIEVTLLALGCAVFGGEADPFGPGQTLGKYQGYACLFAVVLCRLRAFDVALAASRVTAPLRFCGRMCYSLYLTHPLVVIPAAWLCYRAGLATSATTVVITLPLCTLLAVGLGHAFHRAVERRFLNPPARAAENSLAAFNTRAA